MEAQAKCRGDKGLWCRARLCGSRSGSGLRCAGARAKQGSVVEGGSGSGDSGKRRLQRALGVGGARLGPAARRDRGARRTGELRRRGGGGGAF